MGGCSSKPKTVEFDGAMETQEEKPQNKAVGNSVEAERIGADTGLKNMDKEHETSECGVQNTIAEVEHNYLGNMLAETKKHICATFDVEGASKVERQVCANDYVNVKQLVGKEINGNLTAVKEEIGKGSKILGPAASHLPEDSILIKVSTHELKETLAISTIKAGTLSSLEESFLSSKRSFEMQVRPVMLEYENTAVQKHISHDTGASHHQQAESNTLGNNFSTELKKTMVSQKSIAVGDIDLKMPNYPFEETRKRAPTLESQEAGSGSQGQMLDSSARKKKQVGTVEMESQGTSKEAGKEVVELESQKESTGEVTCDDNWYVLEKVEVQNNDLSTLFSKENNDEGFPRTGNDDPRETSRDAFICDDKVLLTSEVLVASEEKPWAQPLHVLDPVGLAFKNILAQELSAPDIDDVLEKLASEFERQESLACSCS